MRQLTDSSGAVTLTKKYRPYGEVLNSAGSGSSSYGFTGEMKDDTGLIFLRARYMDPRVGRFLTKDVWQGDYTRPLSLNAWNYVEGNPINFIDPTGLFSLCEIAESYGLSESHLLGAFHYGLYLPELEGRWAWLKLLLEAKDNQIIYTGSPANFPPFLDTSTPQKLSSAGVIMVGSLDIRSYTNSVLDSPMSPVIWWRDTRPHYYFLDEREYLDDDRPRELPDFRVVNWDIAGDWIPIIGTIVDAGVLGVVDRYGQLYWGVFGGLGVTMGLPISIGEGYIAPYRSEVIPRIRGEGALPSPRETYNTITGPCGNFTFGVGFSPSVSICQSGGFIMTYAYSIGLGGSITLSRTYDAKVHVDRLAWNWVDQMPGVTKEEVYSLLGH